MEIEVKSAELDASVLEARDKPGSLSSFTCPECHGPLWEIRDGELIRFRCRTGHAFTADHMLAEQAEALEAALWVALNTLEESAQMARRLAQEARGRNHDRVAARFEGRAEDAYRRARLVRAVLLTGNGAASGEGGRFGRRGDHGELTPGAAVSPSRAARAILARRATDAPTRRQGGQG
jgi:two-component system chemotaxis response regulator CheB